MSANVVPIDPSDADESDTEEGDRSARAWVAASIAVGSIDPCVASSCSRLDVTASMPTLWRDGGMRSILSRSPRSDGHSDGDRLLGRYLQGRQQHNPAAAEPRDVDHCSVAVDLDTVSSRASAGVGSVGSRIGRRCQARYTPSGTDYVRQACSEAARPLDRLPVRLSWTVHHPLLGSPRAAHSSGERPDWTVPCGM